MVSELELNDYFCSQNGKKTMTSGICILRLRGLILQSLGLRK